MTRSNIWGRLAGLLYPFVTRNDVTDAVLLGPGDILSRLDATVETFFQDGRYLEPGTATLTAGTNTITQIADDGEELIDWTTRFKVDDEVVIGGSNADQSGRYVITAVRSGDLDIAGNPFETTETGLFYAKSTFVLWRRCQELGVYPGGYESDTDLREDVLNAWLTIQQRRGTRRGIIEELSRVVNTTALLYETGVPLTTLATGIAYTASSKTLANTGGWATELAIGSPITVTGSTAGASARYTIVAFSGGNPVIGHRATKARSYTSIAPLTDAVDLQIREERELNQVWFRLVNTSDASATVGVSMTLTNGVVNTATLVSGTGTLTVNSGTSVAITLTAAANGVAEGFIHCSTLDATTMFSLLKTAGAPTGCRIGNLGLIPAAVGGTTDWSQPGVWSWGGLVWTGLQSGVDETGLTVLSSAYPGWYLGLTSPGVIEEDAYTIASPDEMVVVEVDHRNHVNYTDEDVKALTRDVWFPAHVDRIVGFI